MLHLVLAGLDVVAAGNGGDTGILPIGAGGDDVDDDHTGVRGGLGGVAQAIGIDGLKQDGVEALGHALLDLGDLGGGILVGAQNGQLNAQLRGLGLGGLGDGDLERVGLVLLDQSDLVGGAFGFAALSGSGRGGGLLAAAACQNRQCHSGGQEHCQKLFLVHDLSSKMYLCKSGTAMRHPSLDT